MVVIILEWGLLAASAAGAILAAAHVLDSWRGLRLASSSTGSLVRKMVARMARRSAILRLLFALVLLACAMLLIRVPDQEVDYPELVIALTAVMDVAAGIIVLFGAADIRDRRRINELLRDADQPPKRYPAAV